MWVKAMKKEGVSGYLMKEINSSNFIEAIHKVFNGEVVFPESNSITRVSNRIPDDEYNFPLQPEQRIIIRLLIQEHTPYQIADISGINIFKMNYLLMKVRRQLKVKNNVALVAKILQSGLVL